MNTKDMDAEAREFSDRLDEIRAEITRREESDPDFDRYDDPDGLMPEAYGSDIVVRVHCYGGGPAGGVEFDIDSERRDFTAARTWHQDWFQSKGYAPLDTDTAQMLWDYWYVEGMLES